MSNAVHRSDVAPREKAVDRGTRRGRELVTAVSRELRSARIDRGLSLADVARAIGLSETEVSRIERGLIPGTSIPRWSQLLEIVGLELSVRAFPGGSPLRDAGHVALQGQLKAMLHPSWRWASEVPLPIPGDVRAWDALIATRACRYGVEAETAPRDAQALARRIQLKQRDGQVDGVILLLPRSRAALEFVRAGFDVLDSVFPVRGTRALELLVAGVDPGGNAIVMLDRHDRRHRGPRRTPRPPPRPAPRPAPDAGNSGASAGRSP